MTMEKNESQQAAAIRSRPPRDELNLFEHLRVLFKYRWMICLVCIVAALATGLKSFLSPPTYVATASVVPPMDTLRGDQGLGAGLMGTGGASLLRKVMDVGSVVDMYVGILQSRAATDTIIDRFDLRNVYEVGASRHRARARLQADTSFRVSDDGILYIKVEDKDPNRAADIANAYVEELDRLNKTLSVGQTASKRVFLETRLHEMETDLSRPDIPTREEKIQEMLYELLMRELWIAKIEEAKSMPTIQVLDSAVPPERRKARGTIRWASLAGAIAFVVMVFFAFAREYFVECRTLETTMPERRSVQGFSGPCQRRDDSGHDSVVRVADVETHSAPADQRQVELSR